MAGNTLGTLLKLTTFGESHGSAVGGVLDGMPPRVKIDMGFIQEQIVRRSTGRHGFESARAENDQFEFLSGVIEGNTSGSPIAYIVRNTDHRPGDYDHLKDVFRPGHADITYSLKYGIRDHRGGGRASARETINWVIAGSLVQSWLHAQGIFITGFVSAIGPVQLIEEPAFVNRQAILDSSVACPDPMLTQEMETLLDDIRGQGDTLGGQVTVLIDGLPAGLGEPVFDKFHADLAKACMSLNAVKGFEIGEGFHSAQMLGSEYKDLMQGWDDSGKPVFSTNKAGGVLGGITTGQQLRFRVAFKPISSTRQATVVMKEDGQIESLEIKGRHDTCPVPRAVPILESLAALVTGDHLLRFKALQPIL